MATASAPHAADKGKPASASTTGNDGENLSTTVAPADRVTTSGRSDLGTNDAQTAVIPASTGIQKTTDAIDPRTGESFSSDSTKAGGRVGFEALEAGGTVPRYDPDNLPVEITSHVMPAAKDELWAAIRVAAPNLTPELAATYELSEEVLAGIARREIPPPPAVGPIRSSDLYLTPGGWQNVPAGVDPSAIGQNKIAR
jgi:hypothetical protein